MESRFSLLLAIASVCVLGACNRTPVQNPDPNHTHADFAVWVDGKQMDFSGQEFMSAPPKDENEAGVSFIPVASAHGDEDDGHVLPGREYLHLHGGNGHVIHRHKPGLTLADFFTSLSLGFSEKCFSSGIPGQDGEECFEHPFRFFVNGTERPFDGLRYVFEDGDQLLITNAVDQAEITKELKLLTDDACRYSKTCPWRGEPPTENCIADPEVPCINP